MGKELRLRVEGLRVETRLLWKEGWGQAPSAQKVTRYRAQDNNLILVQD